MSGDFGQEKMSWKDPVFSSQLGSKREPSQHEPGAWVAVDDVHALDKVLPTDAQSRKDLPVFSGFLMYFPDAMVAVAELSKVGNDQHNPGQPLFWDRSKSGDELDALTRHLLQAGTMDSDGMRHSAKVAWRAMANLQKEIENEGKG